MNGKKIPLDQSVSVATLIKQLNFTHPLLIVKINDALVLPEAYEQALVQAGDDVKIIHLLTGG